MGSSRLAARILRINLDFLFLDFLILSNPALAKVLLILYLISLLTAINYEKNRYYALVWFWILVHHVITITISESNLFAAAESVLFLAAALLLAGILYVYDDRLLVAHDKNLLSQKFFSSIRSEDTPESMVVRMLEISSEFVGADIGVFFLRASKVIGEEDTFFPFWFFEVLPRDEEMTYVNKSIGLVGEVISKKEKIYISINAWNGKKYQKFKSITAKMETLLIQPILHDGELIGIFSLECETPDAISSHQRQTFSEFLEMMSPIVSLFLKDLNAKSERYREQNKMRGQLLTLVRVAHEIRNHLQGFKNLISYLTRRTPDELDADLLKTQVVACKTLLAQFESDMNKAVEGKEEIGPDIKNITLEKLKEEIDQKFNIRARQVLVRLNTICEFQYLSKVVGVDLDWILAIVDNALTNSAKAYVAKEKERALAGKIKGLHLPRILNITLMHGVIPDDEREYLEIRIEDKAGGLRTELVEKINDQSRLVISDVRWGLDLIKRYVSEMGGTIKAEVMGTTEDKGTLFVIRLPRKKA